MSHAPGTNLGGIRTLDDLKARCVVDDDTGCWHIRQANGRPFTRTAGGKAPSITTPESGSVIARRAAWILARDYVPPKGYVIASKCRCFDCIAPAHSTCVTRKRLGHMVAQDGRASTPAKTANCMRISRNRSGTKLTLELAGWVRNSSQTQQEMAHALGVSQTSVWHIVTGRNYRPQGMPGASVFGWRPGA